MCRRCRLKALNVARYKQSNDLRRLDEELSGREPGTSPCIIRKKGSGGNGQPRLMREGFIVCAYTLEPTVSLFEYGVVKDVDPPNGIPRAEELENSKTYELLEFEMKLPSNRFESPNVRIFHGYFIPIQSCDNCPKVIVGGEASDELKELVQSFPERPRFNYPCIVRDEGSRGKGPGKRMENGYIVDVFTPRPMIYHLQEGMAKLMRHGVEGVPRPDELEKDSTQTLLEIEILVKTSGGENQVNVFHGYYVSENFVNVIGSDV